jgi:hypothetical protein
MTLPNTDININTTKKKLLALGVVALALLVGFAFGKFTTKPNIKIQEKVVTQIQTQVVYKDKIVTNTVVVHDKAKNLIEDTTTDKKPDGEVITTVHEHLVENTQSTNNSQTVKQDQGTDKTTETQTATKTTTITQSQANWRLAAFAGLNTSGLKAPGSLLISGPLEYGGEIDHRFIGPIWLGALAEKSGTSFGINAVVSLQF